SLECPQQLPEDDEEGGEPHCWFLWTQLHTCPGIQLACSSTGAVITPEFWGARFDGRIIKSLLPNGLVDAYSFFPPQYLTPDAIRGLIDVYRLPDSTE